MEGFHVTQLEKSQILTDFLKEKNLNPVYVYEKLELDCTKKKIKL